MPQCLISVTNIEEATIALENGADIIDLKDPTLGALGALSLEKICEITQFVNKQKLVSATIGDLPMQSNLIFNAVEQVMAYDVDYIKIGFFDAEDYADCLVALKPLIEKGAQLIAVLFADKDDKKYDGKNLINAIKAAGFMGVMLDTAIKNGHTLFDLYTNQQQADFCTNVLRQNLTLGLAGSLNIVHIEKLKALKPNYIGFRGGVCDAQNRTLRLNAAKIKAVCKLL